MAPGGRPATRASTPHDEPRAPAHLDAVDVVRVLTVALVIAVHVLAQQPGGVTWSNGAPLIVLHVSREVFFLLTAFVLVYSYRGRAPSRWSTFWRKRYLLVCAPYVVWSVVYFLAGDEPLRPVGHALSGFANDLLTGGAGYHLYFLLVTMQVYLVFPLLRRLLAATRGRHGWLLTGAAVYQLGYYTAVQQGSALGVLTGRLADPSAYLPSYLGFIVAGGVAAWHAETLMRWTLERAWWVFAGCALALAAGVAVFFVQAAGLGQPPLVAGTVFQPVVVVESVAVAWAFLACGVAWQRRSAPGRRLVRSASDASFGVYLAHPLLLQGLLAVCAATGLTAVAQRQPSVLVTAVAVAVVPLIYLACWSAVAVTLRTPLSLALIGRLRRGTAG
ncbi:acyltransferase [Dactylosporangium sp. AC04546]|uniref:acyltransferase n=1 Tax=Dactylosporangium sp. AC04546 TaxID=2862460 RepID=UPI001EDF8871|nr:acyltransferase [Dactylosporangium sp. AC04546]WVK83340.1 acyltransferase [Dactylosporangium sp. AC04546]